MIMDSFEEKYQKKHKRWSYAKSCIRLITCFVVLLMPARDPTLAIAAFALGFMIAEILGIYEEMI
jgi:uncharacterized membrane protein HdeD (DUF308 family)